jgi:hypothetical protein
MGTTQNKKPPKLPPAARDLQRLNFRRSAPGGSARDRGPSRPGPCSPKLAPQACKCRSEARACQPCDCMISSGDVAGDHQGAESVPALGVHSPLGNALAVLVRESLDELITDREKRTARSSCDRGLVTGDRRLGGGGLAVLS